MAWDTEATKNKLKQAAAAEFAEHGLDGTTAERIAKRAGVNKERLYNYFSNKKKLFSVVLSEELNKVAAAVPFDAIDSADAVADYAVAVFRYHAAHPELTRLLLWEGLANFSDIPDEVKRAEYYKEKVSAFSQAQEKRLINQEIPAEAFVFLILSLAGWWFSAPQVAHMMLTDSNSEEAKIVAIRAAALRIAMPSERINQTKP